MRLLFIDPSLVNYTVETPKNSPLGGSQSALCYLVSRLYELGCEVFLANASEKVSLILGVLHLPISALTEASLSFIQPDVCIVLNSTGCVMKLRQILPAKSQLVLWTQHDVDQPAIQELSHPEIASLIDRIVAVSHWQRQRYLDQFNLDPSKVIVLQNAISPYFENLFASDESILEQKLPKVKLAYTSTPFRGLDQLLQIYPKIYQDYRDLSLEVYSSMSVYQVSIEQDTWRQLYEQCKQMEGVNYHGSRSQLELAQALKKVSILSYPNTFAETSCIAVLEAMASGCFIVTSGLGALPETTGGFAKLVELTTDRVAYAQNYQRALQQVIERFRNPAEQQALEEELRAQVDYIHQYYTWSSRSREWMQLLETVLCDPITLSSPEAWQERLKAYLKAGRYGEVLSLTVSLAESWPSEPIWLAYQGAAHIYQNQETEAQLLWSLYLSQCSETEHAIVSQSWAKALLEIAALEGNTHEARFALSSYAYEFYPTTDSALALLSAAIKLPLPQENIDKLLIAIKDLFPPDLQLSANQQEELLEAFKGLLENYPITESCCAFVETIGTIQQINQQISDILFEKILENPGKFTATLCPIYLSIAAPKWERYHLLAHRSRLKGLADLSLKCADQLFNFGLTPLGKDISLTTKCEVLQFFRFSLDEKHNIAVLWQDWLQNSEECHQYMSMALKSGETNFSTVYYSACSYFFWSHYKDDPSFLKPIFNYRNQIISENIGRICISTNAKTSSKKIRIGFIGSCLKKHPAGFQIRSFIRLYNREEFECFGYYPSYSKDENEDDLQQWFRVAFDQFEVVEPNWEKIAEKIHQDQVDLLIDLDSCTIDVTWQVMHQKPAPVQATWVGFDASGIPTVDYFIVDPYILPEGAQAWYTETLWRLPECYLSLDGYEVANKTGIRDQLGLSADAVVFLCAQRPSKIQPEILKLQFAIVGAVPNGVLVVKYHRGSPIFEEWCRSVAEAEGFDLDKLYFLTSNLPEIHRANLYDVDVVLDTYPYAGGAMSLEALWMEVPIVTKVGQQFVSRHTYTFLKNLGIEEGIAFSDEEYVNWGIRFGTEPELRQRVSWKLRQAKRHAPLWNPQRFSREMEKALAAMVHRYRTGELIVPPGHQVGA